MLDGVVLGVDDGYLEPVIVGLLEEVSEGTLLGFNDGVADGP